MENISCKIGGRDITKSFSLDASDETASWITSNFLAVYWEKVDDIYVIHHHQQYHLKVATLS